MKNKDRIIFSILSVLLSGFGFYFGMSHEKSKPQITEFIPIEKPSEIRFLGIEGDVLRSEISGIGRIYVGEEKVAEGNGKLQIPLSKIPTADDLSFLDFPYTGNSKTKKVYQTNSYFGRGIAPENRRRFKTLNQAEQEGFMPGRNVK
jgi:hypothetical protein